MSVADVITTYGRAWDEPDASARRRMLREVWAEDGVYCDPTAVVEGREALVAHIGDFLARNPGHRIVVASRIDEHHGFVRFAWEIRDEAGRALLAGIDFGELDARERLRRIVGFFGPLP